MKTYSIFDLFTVGIGPSSSHTVGPMKAANNFTQELLDQGLLDQTTNLKIELYGSLAMTGKGHGTHKAITLGLMGLNPETIDSNKISTYIDNVKSTYSLKIQNAKEISFDINQNIQFLRGQSLDFHSNGFNFVASNSQGEILKKQIYFSIGGGLIVKEGEDPAGNYPKEKLPHPFENALELLALAKNRNLPISGLILENEWVINEGVDIKEKMNLIWKAMQDCVDRGLKTSGILPGGLKVKRRAPDMFQRLSSDPEILQKDPLAILDWVNLYAFAVGEENANGSKVVTAPTNGAAGIIPAVLHYYDRFIPGSNDEGIFRFLLTAGAIGLLYKNNASISGAEVGCQGEVGVACSMAAAGLTEVLGGSPAQVENAAEMAMEHNLGLTCDPIGGLVQIPCIERNAMGAIKAINAARMSLRGNGEHFVSLDKVIRTMYQTGHDMQTKYKETSEGGLALNLPEC